MAEATTDRAPESSDNLARNNNVSANLDDPVRRSGHGVRNTRPRARTSNEIAAGLVVIVFTSACAKSG